MNSKEQINKDEAHARLLARAIQNFSLPKNHRKGYANLLADIIDNKLITKIQGLIEI